MAGVLKARQDGKRDCRKQRLVDGFVLYIVVVFGTQYSSPLGVDWHTS